MRSTVNHNVGDSNQDVGSFQMPKLPYFVDGKDNIDSYLARFETYAHYMNWPLERYSLCLSSLLTGKALDVLAKIPQSLVHDYEHLKNTLLAEYQLASGDFMKRFFTSMQSGNESATQLMGRLEHYLGRGLDAKRIKSQNEKNELRSVLEWHPAANDVGENFCSLKQINSTLPAFESTVFLYLLG